MAEIERALKDPDAKIIDVRTKAEHEFCSLQAPHILIPLQELNIEDIKEKYNLSENKPLYFLCQKGGRAAVASAQFQKAGFKNCFVLAGGIEECAPELLKLQQNKKIMPLDQQMRIILGVIFLTLSGLGLIFTPLFLWGIALMGLALLISGLTGFCGLMLILAKAPWNNK